MTAVAKLLPCPFCGRSNLIISRMHGTGDRYVVCQTPECKTCGPSGDAREDAIAAWNRRAALSPAELGGVAPYCYVLAGMRETVTGELNFLCNVERQTPSDIPLYTTPRAAEAVTEEMVERALDAMFGSPFGSLSAALTSILGYSAMYTRADHAWRNVYDVSIESDGTTIDNRDEAMRAALTASLTPPSAKGENNV